MHVYVHVPFCARRCSYCDFAIAVRAETPDHEYVDAVRREWRMRRDELAPPASGPIATLYFGGGTPSRLAPDSLGDLIATIATDQPLAPSAEVTLEANPDDVTASRAAAWRRAGVNRVSLGVQSHDPGVLRWMHRTHRAEQVPVAVASLREAGITNLSMDLIFGLPDAVPRDWRRDLDLTLQLEPQHLSAYGLTVEAGTPLGRWTVRGESIPVGDERYAAEYLAWHHALDEAGLRHYEVSNASLPGFESRHNSAYWSGADYLGFGPSAHSHVGAKRSWNLRNWVEYRHRLVAGSSPQEGCERLEPAQSALEQRYLGLRTRTGLPTGLVSPETRAQWLEHRWAEQSGDRIRLTPEGWLRLDALVAALDHS